MKERHLFLECHYAMRILLMIGIIIVMGNLDALVDHFLHPDIPYFHPEHMIIGGVTGTVTVVLMLIIFRHTKHLEQSVRNLEEKKRELLEQKDKLRLITDVIGTGVTVRNRNYELTFQNAYITNLVGNHTGKKCHQVFQNIDYVCPGCPVEMSFADGKIHTSIRKVMDPSGEISFWENTAVPLRNADGIIDSCLEINNNVTERKNIENRIFEIEKLEQARIGRDLHDDLGQVLTGVSFKAKVLRDKIAAQLPVHLDDVEEILHYLNDCKERTRMLAQGLMSLDTEEWNLARALQNMARNTQNIFKIQCEFKCNNENTTYDYAIGTHLYRIAQEAVTNAVKYARAAHIVINLHEDDHGSELIVADDGAGDPDILRKSSGTGIHIMNYRADIIGARLEIKSDQATGTKVICALSTNNKDRG